MSSLEAALIVAVVLCISVPGAYLQIRRARLVESDCARIVREAHERADAAREADGLELLWTLPAYGTGLDRLRQAIRDEQEKGD